MNTQPGIKCVVWDLDGTLWDGVLAEGDAVRLRPGIQATLETLDRRGILHSIASKNDPALAMAQLHDFKLHEYFLYPEISWNSKSTSVERIRSHLNIQSRSILFVDDEAWERDEVRSVHPEVVCWDAGRHAELLEDPRLNPPVITEDSERRRLIYRAQMQRQRAEEEFVGPRAEFLASLGMHLAIARATEDDLRRAEELTVRTHQLNTTGRTYGYEELKAAIDSPHQELLICDLKDKYGHHGKVGLALVDLRPGWHHLRLLLMSCRVMSLGIGSVLLAYVMRKARQSGCLLRADFRRTSQNRPMYITFKLSHFKEGEREVASDGCVLLENDLAVLPPYPAYLHLTLPADRKD